MCMHIARKCNTYWIAELLYSICWRVGEWRMVTVYNIDQTFKYIILIFIRHRSEGKNFKIKLINSHRISSVILGDLRLRPTVAVVESSRNILQPGKYNLNVLKTPILHTYKTNEFFYFFGLRMFQYRFFGYVWVSIENIRMFLSSLFYLSIMLRLFAKAHILVKMVQKTCQDEICMVMTFKQWNDQLRLIYVRLCMKNCQFMLFNRTLKNITLSNV